MKIKKGHDVLLTASVLHNICKFNCSCFGCYCIVFVYEGKSNIIRFNEKIKEFYKTS